MSELLSDVHLLSQCLVSVRLEPGLDWMNHRAFQRCCKQTEIALEGQGRLLIRPSGTEPVLRIMVESADSTTSKAHADLLIASLKSHA